MHSISMESTAIHPAQEVSSSYEAYSFICRNPFPIDLKDRFLHGFLDLENAALIFKRLFPQGFLIIVLSHSGIPEKELHSEKFSECQLAVLNSLPPERDPVQSLRRGDRERAPP